MVRNEKTTKDIASKFPLLCSSNRAATFTHPLPNPWHNILQDVNPLPFHNFHEPSILKTHNRLLDGSWGFHHSVPSSLIAKYVIKSTTPTLPLFLVVFSCFTGD